VFASSFWHGNISDSQVNERMAESESSWRSIAEPLVRGVWGSETSLGTAEALGGSDRSFVHRVDLTSDDADAPQTVVVKQAHPYKDQVYDPDSKDSHPAFGLLNDWAGLAYLDEQAPSGPWPRFYGGDRASGTIVLEDLGSARQIDHVLQGEDSQEAEDVLMAFVQALAEMHCATAGSTDRYHEIRSALGPRVVRDHVRRIRTFEDALTEQGITAPGLSLELERCAEALANPGPFLAYTHGDPCPDNCLVLDGKVWLLDFEWAEVRHALIDGVFPWIHFPSCWCVNRLPGDLPERLLNSYRDRLVEGIPEASDDDLFGVGLLAASVAGFVNNFGGVFEEDRKWGISTVRQRCLMRVGILERTAESYGYPAIADASARLSERIHELWSDVEPMPIYPAFRI
jgi:hypothetical protein